LVQKHGSGKLKARIRNKKKTEPQQLGQGEDSPTHNMDGVGPVDTTTSIAEVIHDMHPPKNTSNNNTKQENEHDNDDDCQQQQQQQQERRPDLFFLGIVIKVNGYTDPDSESLKRLIQKYGGDYELYETSRVTHIVAETLSKAKVDYYTSASSKQPRLKRPIVQPRWIVDSIQSQRLLPWTDYTCSVIRNQLQKPNQPGIRDIFQPHHDDHSKATVSTLADIHELQTEPLVHSIQQSSSSSSSSLLFSTQQPLMETPSSTTHAIVVEDGLDNGAKDFADDNHPDPDSKCAPSLLLMKNHAEQTSTTAITVPTVTTTRHEEPTTISSPSTSKQQRHADSKYIQGRIRTTGTDPNFLDSFFANSRLSFIGSYQQRTTTAAAPPFATSGSTTIASIQQIVPVCGDNSSNNIQRFVFHVDMDCFFANVVLRKYPQYRDQPVVISHHGKTLKDREEDPKSSSMKSSSSSSTSECATCNYHARKFGIQKGMFLGRARQLCPDLIVLPYDFDGYEEVSEQVMSILHRVAAEFDGCVEAVSCDEAYVEVSLSPMNMVSSTAIILPEDFAGRIAESIRQEIFETTQCTASIGVASNKFLAKIGTDRVKPNGTYVVKDYRTILESLRLRDLHGIGYRSEPKLAAQGLNTVQDVWDLGLSAEAVLSQILGPGLGKKIYGYCQGKDDREVKAAERKTIGAECNYGVRFDGPYGIDHFMNRLAVEVSRRMEKVGYKGTKLTLKVKQRKAGAKPPPKVCTGRIGFLVWRNTTWLKKCLSIAVSWTWELPQFVQEYGPAGLYSYA
jgi:DNA repair protein REV1